MAGNSTSVHPQETPVGTKTAHLAVELTAELQRVNLAAAMTAANLRPTTIENFLACERDAVALELKDRPGTFRIVRVTCRSKWCPRCSWRRARSIRHALEPAMKHRQIRLITLTVTRSARTLTEQIKHLMQSFRRLRALTNWKQLVNGGAYFLELTRGAAGDHWHPHLHLICEGLYYEHANLRRDWLRATGDSTIVHITFVRDHRTVGGYVTKYLTKPLEQGRWLDDRTRAEAIDALQHRRLVGTFGTWQKHKLLAKPATPPARLVGWIAELRIKASDGDQLAKRLCQVYDAMPATAMSVDCTAPPVELGRLDNGSPWDYAEVHVDDPPD